MTNPVATLYNEKGETLWCVRCSKRDVPLIRRYQDSVNRYCAPCTKDLDDDMDCGRSI